MEKVTVHLKLAKKHPKAAFRVHDIVVEGYVYKPYTIDEKIAKELQEDPGVKAWVKCKELEEGELTEEVELSEEELSQLEDAKGQDEVAANDAAAEPAPAPSDVPAESQEAAPEMIDEKEVVEEKPKKRNR